MASPDAAAGVFSVEVVVMVARRAGIDEKLDAEMLELHGAVRGSDRSSKGTLRYVPSAEVAGRAQSVGTWHRNDESGRVKHTE